MPNLDRLGDSRRDGTRRRLLGGWLALGGLFQLGSTVGHAFEIVFIIIGFIGLYYFMRTAVAHEPFRR